MEAGVNVFDRADVYGSGHSEELLANATKGKKESTLLLSFVVLETTTIRKITVKKQFETF